MVGFRLLLCFRSIFLCLLLLNTCVVWAQTKVNIAFARNIITPAEEVFSFAVPKQLGYFQTEGLDVHIIKTNGSMAALQAVALGNADIGFASSTQIATAYAQGMPVVAFAGMTVRWPYFLAVAQDSSIQTVADLRGKRVGVISLSSASCADLKANLYYAGLSEKDVTIVPVGAGIKAAIALQNHHVDAIVSYSDSFARMRQNGIELTILPRPQPMESLFSVTMFTSRQALHNNPEMLIRFARSAYKGIIYTHLYPDSALALGFKEFPELAGSHNPQSEEAQNTKEVLLIALADTVPQNNPDIQTWGQWLNIGAKRWDNLLNFAYKTGLTPYLLTADQIWDSSLIERIYDFDLMQITENQP